MGEMPEKPRRLLLIALFAVCVSIVTLTSLLVVGKFRKNAARVAAAQQLQVNVVNVGHGTAAWIRTPGGQFILIGGGPPEAAPRVIDSLRTAGAKQIDLLILPYPYAEAIGGLPAILDVFPVESAIEPGGPRVNQFQETMRTILAQDKVPVRMGHKGDSLTLGGVKVDLLAPPQPLLTATPTSANNSLVVQISWGTTRFLFAGGIERAGEDSLIASAGDTLRSDWLEVPRFGTREASSPEFLRLVSPQFAVVSVGTPNSGGYPHAETLERLRATGARLFRTDETSADLMFASDGITVTAAQ